MANSENVVIRSCKLSSQLEISGKEFEISTPAGTKLIIFKHRVCAKLNMPPPKSRLWLFRHGKETDKDSFKQLDVDGNKKKTLEELGLTGKDVRVGVETFVQLLDTAGPSSSRVGAGPGYASIGSTGSTPALTSGSYGGSYGGSSSYLSTYSYGAYGKNDNGMVGLMNQGATCYLNSLLQSLYMVPEFRRMVYSWEYQPGKDAEEDRCIPLQLQLLFANLQTSENRAVRTTALTSSFGWTGIEAFRQHDAEELLHVLFDALEKTVANTPQADVVTNMFKGKIKDYVKCRTCSHESARVVPYIDFSLEVANVTSLEEAMHNYTRPEILSGDNAYFCEKCNGKQDALKGLAFLEFPPVLTISLKRFTFDWTYDRREKLNSFLEFPEELDVSAFLSRLEDEADDHDLRCFSPTKEQDTEFLEARKKRQIEDCQARIKRLQGYLDSSSEYLKNYYKDQIEKEEEKLARLEGRAVQGTAPSKHRSETGIRIDAVTRKEDKAENSEQAGSVPVSVENASEPAKAVADTSAASKPEVPTIRLTSTDENRYELAAVLIHSGGATGGHYYAYVKSPVSGKWYNFNDSSVSVIDQDDLKKAFGSKPGTGGGYFSSTSYGASAYMLMYRQAILVDADRAASGTKKAAPMEEQAAETDVVMGDTERKNDEEKTSEDAASIGLDVPQHVASLLKNAF